MEQLEDQIISHATKLGFTLYRPIFIDTEPGSPFGRPAFRVLLDIVWELHIPAVIAPSIWHLSLDKTEADEVRQRLAIYDCKLILVRPR